MRVPAYGGQTQSPALHGTVWCYDGSLEQYVQTQAKPSWRIALWSMAGQQGCLMYHDFPASQVICAPRVSTYTA